jgi:hypothetical protein
LPRNGIDSVTDTNLNGSLTTGIASPRNFANQSGSINLSTPTTNGDYNGNHVVDAADYAVWRDRLNQQSSPPGTGADGDGNGTTTAADYTYWRARFGNAVPGSGQGAVDLIPEPSTILALTVWLFMAQSIRRRKSVPHNRV